jgi:regulator of nucleoside diphosphate kinase
MMTTPILTRADRAQLRELIAPHLDMLFSENRQMKLLDRKLEQARVLPSLDVPPDVVTMHSTVLLRLIKSRRTMMLTLVFPQEASLSRSRLSVLTPLGTALLGASEGDEIVIDDPAGIHDAESRSVRVLRVLFQPESARCAGQSEMWLAREWYSRPDHNNDQHHGEPATPMERSDGRIS